MILYIFKFYYYIFDIIYFIFLNREALSAREA